MNSKDKKLIFCSILSTIIFITYRPVDMTRLTGGSFWKSFWFITTLILLYKVYKRFFAKKVEQKIYSQIGKNTLIDKYKSSIDENNSKIKFINQKIESYKKIKETDSLKDYELEDLNKITRERLMLIEMNYENELAISELKK